MSLGYFAIRKHGAANFTTLAGEYTAPAEYVGQFVPNNLLLVTHKIKDPAIKNQSIEIEGANGEIDFTDVLGVKYSNRDITLTLREYPTATPFDFDGFRRAYHGQDVDVIFSPTATHYYRGRLSITDDNYAQSYRTIKIKIDALPFRYPIAGATTVSLPSNDFSYRPQSSGDVISGGGVTIEYAENPFGTGTIKTWEITPDTSAQERFRYAYVRVTLPANHFVRVAAAATISGNDNPRITVTDPLLLQDKAVMHSFETKITDTGGLTASVTYSVYEDVEIYVYFRPDVDAMTVSDITTIFEGVPLVNVEGGDNDADVKVTYDGEYTAEIVLNGKIVGKMLPEETADFKVLPYLKLKPDNNEVAAFSLDTTAATTITYEKAVL